MSPYHYHNKQLYLEQVAIRAVADQVETPFYIYSESHIKSRYLAYQKGLSSLDSQICYALKANSNQAIIGALAKLGAGADVVSEGELRRAFAAGISPDKIVYSGVAKTNAEIGYALQQRILQFNVESLNELLRINQIAMQTGTKAAIALRINPDVDAKTHEKISTGKAENKFGIPIQDAPEVYRLASTLPGIRIQGVDMHIGSQLTDLAPYRTAFALLFDLVKSLRTEGHPVDHIDLGGGLGVGYDPKDKPPSIRDYCQTVSELLADWDGKVLIEPGRSLVAESGLLITSVIYIKQGQSHKFCILDAGMNDLLRPAMYGALHHIIPETQKDTKETYDVVGPICETGDTFARDYIMPTAREGDYYAFTYAGAYGAAMASNYNSRLSVPEVLVKDDQFAIIRPRYSYEALIAQDQLPDWK